MRVASLLSRTTWPGRAHTAYIITASLRPPEYFSAVEKLLMACCTMQAEDDALPRGDTEDTKVRGFS